MNLRLFGTLALSAAAMVVIGMTVGGCTTKPQTTYTYGPTTATGTLIRAEVSLVRRGTHALMIDGVKTYYVESRTLNLSEFEGQTVGIQGNLEPNTVKDELPVLVAETIKGSFDSDLHRYEIPALNLRLGIPLTWQGKVQQQVATFSLPGETQPLLQIKLYSGSTLPPGGSLLFIKNRRATRIDAQNNAADVFILEKNTIISIHFDPTSQTQIKTKDDADLVLSQFERILSTISFLSDTQTTQTTQTGAMVGTPCGGTAGVLCPAGYFCDITDFTNQVGQCKARK